MKHNRFTSITFKLIRVLIESESLWILQKCTVNHLSLNIYRVGEIASNRSNAVTNAIFDAKQQRVYEPLSNVTD